MMKLEPSEGLRLINSGPVIMVSCGREEAPNAITLAWNMVAAKKPPLAVVAIVPARHSYKLIKRDGVFVINVPGSDLVRAVMYCGTHSGKDGDKFGPAGITPVPAETVGTVYIKECPARLECELRDTVSAGDHDLLIGEVKGAFAEEEVFDGFWRLDSARARTLHHLGGDKFGVLSERIKV